MARALHEVDGEDDQDPLSPEALLISAFLETGTFDPEPLHVRDQDIEAWSKLWAFGREYQASAGTAPPMSLVKQRFPDFEPITDVSVEWAAGQVRNAGAMRELRHHAKAMLAAAKDDDLEGAFEALENVHRPPSQRRHATSVLDHSSVAEQFDVKRIEVPYPSLMKVTNGGIADGELWYLAARLGKGKSTILLDYAAAAAKCGVRVCIHSLEMPYRQVAWRTALRLAAKDKILVDKLRRGDQLEKKEALDEIGSTLPGSIEVLDPGHGAINTLGSVRESCYEYDLVLVDHVGLMRDHTGKRAVEDWRVMATISNVLREITLETNTTIFGAAQVNRGGEKSGGTPPKASDLAQSDALGQDADVLLTMSEYSERVRAHSAEKVRNGPSIRWWTRFDYDRNDFTEISKEMAEVLKAEDTDRAERYA